MSLGRVLSAPARAMQRLSGNLASFLEGPSAQGPQRPSAPLTRPQQPRQDPTELIRALRHRRVAVRVRAARAMGAQRFSQGIGALEETARNDKREVRQAALGALLELDPDRFAESVVNLSRVVCRAELFADLDAMLESAVRLPRTRGNRERSEP